MTRSLMNKNGRKDLEILENLVFHLLDEKHHQWVRDWMETDEYKNSSFITKYSLLNSFRMRNELHKS